MSYQRIVLRLTDRPEIERSPWLVHPDWESVTVTCREGRVAFVPTDHEVDGLPVWVPEHRLDEWKTKS